MITSLLNDDEYRQLQTDLTADPKLGDLIPGTGGLRKVRIALPGTGKSGGARVIYFLKLNENNIFMLAAYAKNDQEDLTSVQKTVLKRLIQGI
jgi:hypothetical protein